MKILYAQNAPQPIGPYSQGIEVDGFIFLSGQIGLKPDGQISGVFADQTHQVMKNISAMLESAGCSFSDVVKSTVYLKTMNDFADFNKIYAEYFSSKKAGQTVNPPARTTVEVSSLPRNALIEIDIIAHK